MSGGPIERDLAREIDELKQWRELWVDPRLKEHDAHSLEITKLREFKNLVLGVGVAVGAVVGFFGAELRAGISRLFGG